MQVSILTGAVAAICIAGSAYGQGAPDPRGGPSTPVTVVNTPLPVTGSLGVSGTVGINNSATSPVPVRDVENPARKPFQAAGFESVTGQFSEREVAVPAGARLVIEHVTGSVVVPVGQARPQFISVLTTLDGAVVDHNFPVAFLTSTGIVDVYAVAAPTRLYSDAGTTSVRVRGIRTALTGSASFDFSISGHLVNCGAGLGCPIP